MDGYITSGQEKKRRGDWNGCSYLFEVFADVTSGTFTFPVTLELIGCDGERESLKDGYLFSVESTKGSTNVMNDAPLCTVTYTCNNEEKEAEEDVDVITRNVYFLIDGCHLCIYAPPVTGKKEATQVMTGSELKERFTEYLTLPLSRILSPADLERMKEEGKACEYKSE